MLKQSFRSAYFLPLFHDAGTSLACSNKPSISLYSQLSAHQRRWNDFNAVIRVIFSERVWKQLEKQSRGADFPLRADTGLRLRRRVQTPSEKWQMTPSRRA